MSGQELEGLVVDMGPDPAPAPAESGGGWASLREIGGWWGLLRFLPSAIRQALSGQEPVGGLPVVEPGQSRPADPPEIDFGDSYPTGDHTTDLTAEVVADRLTTPALDAEAVAESGDPASVAEAVADLAASLGVDLDAAAVVAAPVAEATAAEAPAEATVHADAAEAVAELGEVGL